MAPNAVAVPRQQRVPKEEHTAGILPGPSIMIDSDF